MLSTVEGVGGVAALEFDEHLHPLEGGQIFLGIVSGRVVEGDIRFVLGVVFEGGSFGRVERLDSVADRIRNVSLCSDNQGCEGAE